MPPLQAALRGSKEIGFTVLSMSISLVAVFIPILLMGGIVGRLFREFAVTLAVAIGVSLIVSLTTTPMMCAKFLRPRERSGAHGWFYNAGERAFDWLLRRLRPHAHLGAAASAADAAGHASGPSPECLPLHRRAQGLLPAAGHGPPDGLDRQARRTSRSPPCAQKLAAVHRHRAARSGGRERRRLHRAAARCNTGARFRAVERPQRAQGRHAPTW